MHTVHVRVNDAATGKPTACRIRFTDAEGRYYAPFGRLTDFWAQDYHDVGGNLLLGDKQYAYIDGACEIQLPGGLLTVEIIKGIEYKPLCEQMGLAAGKLALRFTLERWADFRRERWHSGDTGAHALTPHAALLEGAAEDLAVVNLLAEEIYLTSFDQEEKAAKWHEALPNIHAFSGQAPALQQHDCMVVVNTLNRAVRLGQLALLNSHRPVFPLRFGHESGQEACGWTLADWCDQCHRKAGLVLGQYFTIRGVKTREKQEIVDGELLADLILGKIDALEAGPLGFFEHEEFVMDWRAVLNAGFRVPLAAGSAKRCNRDVLGSPRTYARLQPGQEINYKNWIEAVRGGRTFITRGPLLTLIVNGQDPGAVLDASSSVPTVQVRAEARSWVPFRRLEVVSNGAIVGQAEATGSPAQAVVEMDLPLSGPCWLAACCWIPKDGSAQGVLGAHTSPVYIQLDGNRLRPEASTAAPLFSWLDQVYDWVMHQARSRDERDRQRLAAVFQAARQELLRRQTP